MQPALGWEAGKVSTVIQQMPLEHRKMTFGALHVTMAWCAICFLPDILLRHYGSTPCYDTSAPKRSVSGKRILESEMCGGH